jgi:predicted RNA-binding Zn-ribbon protein involved in translation (DUF1610 family)
MNIEAYLLAKLLGGDSTAIPYRPELAKAVGSISAAVLLQQMVFNWNRNGQKAFYKFKGPCEHRLCKDGDSWLEEIGFTRSEFDTALKKIAVKKTQGVSMEQAYQANMPIVYWTAPSRVTYYDINLDALFALIAKAYNVELKQDSCFTKSDIPALDQKQESRFTISENESTTEKPASGKPSKVSFVGGSAVRISEAEVLDYIEVELTPWATTFRCPACNEQHDWPKSKNARRKKAALVCSDCGAYFHVVVMGDYGPLEKYKWGLPTDEWRISLDKYPGFPVLICDKKEADRFISNWQNGQALMEDKITWAALQAWWIQQQDHRVQKLNAAFDTSFEAWKRAQSAQGKTQEGHIKVDVYG